MFWYTAAFFAELHPRLRRSRSRPPAFWTSVGGLTIPLWATWPALSLQTRAIPALECLTLIFAVGWLVSSVLERPDPGAEITSSSLRLWIPSLAFALGETGSAVFFLLAIQHIPAAEANLIMYLWPGMVVGLGAVLGLFRLRLRHGIGILLGFAGAAILMAGPALSLSYGGAGLALLAGAAWAAYCVFRLIWQATTGPILARGFGICAVLCAALHALLEPSVMPDIAGAAAAVAVGIVPTAIANWTWDQGFRKGDSQLLAVMAYGTPLCSALFLMMLGLEPFTWKLVIGALVIVIAGVMSRADAPRARLHHEP